MNRRYIRAENRFDSQAYRVKVELSDTVETLLEGQWLSPVEEEGRTTYKIAEEGDKFAVMAVGSMRPGRNALAGAIDKYVSVLFGTFILDTLVFDDEQTYEVGDALKIAENGKLTKATDDEDAVAIVWGPVSQDGYLRIASK